MKGDFVVRGVWNREGVLTGAGWLDGSLNRLLED